MAWLTVEEYAKMKGITIQAVYTQIKKDKLNFRKGDKGIILVQTDLDGFEQNITIERTTDSVKYNVDSQLEAVKDFIDGLVREVKLAKDSEISTLKEGIDNIKETHNRIVAMKDEKIDEQKKELDHLKNQITELIHKEPEGFKELKDQLKIKDDQIQELIKNLSEKNKGLFNKLFGK